MKRTGRGWLIAGAIGFAALGFGLFFFAQEMLFLKGAQLTQASVTENKLYDYTGQVNEYGVQHYYCSEFQFRTRAGRSVSFEEIGCGALDQPPDYKIGQKVNVYYDPANPDQGIQLQSFEEQFSFPVTLIVAGSLVLLVAIVLFWTHRV